MPMLPLSNRDLPTLKMEMQSRQNLALDMRGFAKQMSSEAAFADVIAQVDAAASEIEAEISRR